MVENNWELKKLVLVGVQSTISPTAFEDQVYLFRRGNCGFM